MSALDLILFFFFFKQKTAYEMRISDWSSDVCSSDLETAASTPTIRDCATLRSSYAWHLTASAAVEHLLSIFLICITGVFSNFSNGASASLGFPCACRPVIRQRPSRDRKSTRLNSSH